MESTDASSSNDNKRKRSKTSVACAACKSRKTKCSGGHPPCDSCTRLHTVCVFHPGSDMRRRDSKDHFKAYKALLDAFVTSTRSGDLELSSSLYRAIQLTDSSGKLAEIAQSYAQAVNTGIQGSSDSPQNEFQYKLGKTRIKLSANATVSSSTEADSLLQIFSDSMLQQSPVSGNESNTNAANPFPPSSSGLSVDYASDTEAVSLVDSGCQTDSCLLEAPPPERMFNHGTSRLSIEDRPFTSFKNLQQFWNDLDSLPGLHSVTNIGLPNTAYDPILLKAIDPLSKSILDFRDGARRAIQSGESVHYVLGTAVPSLESYFSSENIALVYSAWSWACQFASAFPELPFTLHLGTIYMAGMQMRFYIYPCEATFNDLPYFLRPVRKQYTTPHAAGLDICHIPVVKDYLFTHWDDHDSLLIKLVANQNCNWPYSNSACLQPEKHSPEAMTMSQAFLEHIQALSNYTLGSNIISLVPQLMNEPISETTSG